MKKLVLLLTALYLAAGVGSSFGQVTTQSIDLSDGGLYGGTNTSGTFNPTDAFNINTSVTFTGFTGRGLSYWLEVPNALAPFISITGESYATWTDANQTFFGSDLFNSASGNDPGFMNEVRDLGGTSIFNGTSFVQDKTAGTYPVSTVNFSLSGAPAGTYSLQLTTLTPRQSEISDTQNFHHLVSTSTYTITVVPEPATWTLIGLGGFGVVGLTWLRSRRKS